MFNSLQKSSTQQEIIQQPEMWIETWRNIQKEISQIDSFLQNILRKKNLQVILTGAGSSAFIGDMLAPHLSRVHHIPVSAVPTTDIVSNPDSSIPLGCPLLLISFARSGSSPESVETVRLADQLNPDCYHLIITCNRDGELYNTYLGRSNALTLLLPDATCDRGFAMTSSLTSMMLACLLALDHSWRSDINISALAESAASIIRTHEEYGSPLMESGANRVIWLGSGLLQGTAHESSLKLLELTAGRIASFYESPLGFRHGPKSLVDDSTHIIVMLSNNPHTRSYDIDLFNELCRENVGIRVTALSGTPFTSDVGKVITLAGTESFSDGQMAFCYLIYAQYLALSASLHLGFAPDNPSPDGIVNRVVKGVTLYAF